MQQKSTPEQEEAKRKELEEKRIHSLAKLLTSEAKERLNRIRLVKPEKARLVEDMLLQMSSQHQLGGQIQDDQIVELLNKVSSQEKKEITIVHRGKREEESLIDGNDEDW